MDRLFTVVPIIVALVIGSATLTTGFHVAYKAADRTLGIVKLAPWASRTSATVVEMTRSLLRLFTGLMQPRAGLAVATLALLLTGAIDHEAAQLAMVAVAGQLVTNIDALEREFATKAAHARAVLEKHAKAANEHTETIGNTVAKGRPFTDEEKREIQAALDDAERVKAMIARAKGDDALAKQIEQLNQNATQRREAADAGAKRGPARILSFGEQWITSAAGKFFFEKRHHGSRNWQSPSVELLPPDLQAATLTTADTSGGDLIVPQYTPGIVELLYKPLLVRDLIASGRTDSPIIKYMKETTFTNAAAMVAEGGTKPESTLVFDIATDEVEKCAHWLPVTEEMLEDVAQIRSVIDARLRLGLNLTIDDQLLNGDGTSPNISGILDRSGLATPVALGADTIPDAIFKQITAIFTSAWVAPDGIVMNPSDWQDVQLMKDANGQYYGSGPFTVAQRPTLWGLPVAVTPTIAAGTALVGAFKSASQWFSKGGVRVEASNSHSDYFIKNLVAIRAEERLALAVYRPAAFGTVTGL